MKIKVLLVMPGKEPQIVRIPASIKYIKSFIGENLYRIKLSENTTLIANRDANMADFNRMLGDKIILGTFFVVSKKKDIRKYTNMFKLRKHQKKIDIYREDYLEEYYSNQRKMKQKNAKRNKEQIFKIAA